MQVPRVLLKSLQTINGFDANAFNEVHQLGHPVISIRVNHKKFTIQNSGLDVENPVPWSSNGYYLKERPSFTLDPLFHAGAYYVQEASSMFLEEVMKQIVDLSKPLKILDLCAAPGGKSTLLQSLVSPETLLVSNEVIKSRVNILAENITKWGAANVIVSSNDPKDFGRLASFFDVIIVDAPCSGSGLFRKDPASVEEWSENNVALCSQRQQRILADVMPALKKDGILIYSTCSYSTEENESICDWLVEKQEVESLQLTLATGWGIIETESEKNKAYGYRFYPYKVKGEGFFIAAFRKRGNEIGEWREASRVKRDIRNDKQEKKPKKRTEQFPSSAIDILQPFLQNSDAFFFIKQNEDIIAMPAHFQKDLYIIKDALYIKKAGIKLGTIIRNELIPDHELALSTIINPSVERIELDKENALQYLRRQLIKHETAVKGWALITYRHLPLGWVKILPNRINNYYPAAWRILNK